MNTYWNRERMKALILYVIQNTDREINIHDLTYMLYFIDMEFMKRHGKSITNSTYIKTTNGVKIRGLESIVHEMVHDKTIKPLTID